MSLNSTFRARIDRELSNPESLAVIPHLPKNGAELIKAAKTGWSSRDLIIYDSITEMDLSSADFAAMIDTELAELQRECRSTGQRIIDAVCLHSLRHDSSHIWIAQAQKDGRAYLGGVKWAHDADIVIRCEAGKAMTLKNRFGPGGRDIGIF